MKHILWAALLFLLVSCAAPQPGGLPELIPLTPVAGERRALLLQACEQGFVRGNYQFVHSITFAMTGGHSATVIGVTVLEGEKLKTALMGVEGFVLFEAEQDKAKGLQVSRALPPFDNPAFAAGLMRDVETIFLRPSGETPVTGELAGGQEVCRYVGEGGQITDVVLGADGSRNINVYDADGERSRVLDIKKFTFIDGGMFAETIQLTAFALRGYTLKMILISAERL